MNLDPPTHVLTGALPSGLFESVGRRAGALLARLSEKANQVETDQRFASQVSRLVSSGCLKWRPFADRQRDHIAVFFHSGHDVAKIDLLKYPFEPLMNRRILGRASRAAEGAVRPKSFARRLYAKLLSQAKRYLGL